MCRLMIISGFILIVNVLHAQDPYFEMTLHFEDAIGNVDSVILGYDPNSTPGNVPEFGEEDIKDIPFDSVLDVRVAPSYFYFDHEEMLSKKIITIANSFSETDSCYKGVAGLMILMNTKYPPLTISWNKEVINNSPCRNNSYLVEHIAEALWWDWNQDSLLLKYTVCLGHTDEYIFNFDFLNDTIINPDGLIVSADLLVEGKGIQTIYGMWFRFLPPFIDVSPCLDFPVFTDPVSEDENIVFYPNPVNDFLYARLDDEISSYSLVSSEGQLIQDGNSYPIDMSNLRSGIYFIQYQVNREIHIEKIIKLE